jgi:anti-sigma factor RsiW
MTHSDNQSDCFERAQMHERLAASTNDTAARQMHQAMAAEFRRRAAQPGSEDMPQQPSARGPLLEMSAPR